MTASVQQVSYFFFGAGFLVAFLGTLQAMVVSFGTYCITTGTPA